MARSLRDLRRKMKAIRSTRQVTKAMELVAASKMRRAVQNAEMLRRYAQAAWNILRRIAAVHPDAHPFLAEKPVKNVLVVIFGSDRGFCGSLNAQLFQAAGKYIDGLKKIKTFEKADFVVTGRKPYQYLTRAGHAVTAAFPALSNHPTFKDVLPIARMATDGFLNGTYDHVVVIYPAFLSALRQEPRIRVLLPFSRSELREMVESLILRHPGKEQEKEEDADGGEYKFEPSQDEVLKTILPQLTEMQIFQGVLEAAASEHSARMVAMRNATDNATDLLGDLSLTYNQTRQANITAELSELSAAAAALG